VAALKIGQVATLGGVGIDTVRYYERLGLLPPAPRRASGYRMFDESTVARIRLIKQLQDLGLSLQEIDAMLRATGEHATCAHESDKIRAALARTDDKIAALLAVRTKLQGALERCTTGACTIMVQVSSVTKPGSRASRPASASDRRPGPRRRTTRAD
jgi:MerR family copper efflux transcriptional regulator